MYWPRPAREKAWSPAPRSISAHSGAIAAVRGWEIFLSRQRFEVYAESYRQHSLYPANTLVEGFRGKQHFIETQAAVIERLAKAGVI